MAIFGKKRETVDEKAPVKSAAASKLAVPAQAAPVPAPASSGEAPPKEEAKPEGEGSRLVVGSNVRLTGSEISDCDTAIVEGRVEATVDGRVMQITETGMFTGTVAIDMAEIRGQFNGELTVRKRLTVCGTGKVKGKIRYGTLVVEEGGELSGDVDSLTTAPAATATTGAPKSPVVTSTAPMSVSKPEVVQGGYSTRGAMG